MNSPDKRELILTVATKYFTRHGFHKTTMAEIAREARVGKATIYQLFEDKLALLGAVYQQKAAELKSKMMESVSTNEGTVIARLLRMLNIAREFCSKDPLFVQFRDLREVEQLEAIPQFNSIENNAVTLINDVLQEGINRGEIRPMPTEMASHILFRVGFYLSLYGHDLFEKFSAIEILELFDGVLTSGIVMEKTIINFGGN